MRKNRLLYLMLIVIIGISLGVQIKPSLAQSDGDSDGDGVLDNVDACPTQGDTGNGIDATGCPNPAPQPVDSDGDGVLDNVDACPTQGDAGNGIDATGCPNPAPQPIDSDGDGVLDNVDACPTQGDAGNGIDATGCPNPAPQPVVTLLVNPASGIAGQTVFTFSNQTSGFNVVRWTIAGVDYTETSPTLTIDQVGTLQVTLTVSDGNQTLTGNGAFTVNPPPIPITAGLSATPKTGALPLEVNFGITASGNNITCELATGDGSTYDTCESVTHTYTGIGPFQATLTVIGDGEPATDTLTIAPYPELQPPVVDFHWNAASDGVYFYNSSTGIYDTLNWLTSTGETSTDPNPVFHLPVGTHSVTLHLTGDAGEAEVSKTVNILPTPQTSAGFILSPTSGKCAAPCVATVQLNATGEVISTDYDWGDNSFIEGASETTTHEYTQSGIYNIIQTIDTPAGLITSHQTLTVYDAPFSVTCSASAYVLEAPAIVDLTAHIENGTAETIDWDFGDTQSGSGLVVSHTYPYNDTYYAVVTVVNAAGEIASNFCQIQVVTSPDAETWFYLSPDSGNPPLDVAFTPYYVGQISISTSLINWGDGSTVSAVLNPPPHHYAEPGQYTVTWSIVDGNGVTHTKQHSINVYTPVKAVIQADHTSCDVPCAIAFDASGSSGANRYNWTMNDGRNAWGQQFTRNFTQPGEYQVTLLAQGNGGSDSTTLTINITQAKQAGVSITSATPRGGFAPLTVCINATTTGSITQTVWTDGNGHSGAGASFCTTYSASGTYFPRVTVSGPLGSQSASTMIRVYDHTAAQTQIGTSPGIGPYAICFFTNTVGAVNYRWLFPDGTIDYSANPCKDFHEPGSYDVFVEVNTSTGLQVGDYLINLTEPIAATETPLPSIAPTAVSLLTATPTNIPTASATPFIQQDVGLGRGSISNAYYTVETNDYLKQIARNQCGDENKWLEIYNDNVQIIGSNPNLIFPGQVLYLRCKDAPPPTGGGYTVRSGDYLYKIAREQCGDGNAWRTIYDSNIGVIGSNPNILQVGQVLQINCAGIIGRGQAAPPSVITPPITAPTGSYEDLLDAANNFNQKVAEAERNLDTFEKGPYLQAKDCDTRNQQETDQRRTQLASIDKTISGMQQQYNMITLAILNNWVELQLRLRILSEASGLYGLFPNSWTHDRLLEAQTAAQSSRQAYNNILQTRTTVGNMIDTLRKQRDSLQSFINNYSTRQRDCSAALEKANATRDNLNKQITDLKARYAEQQAIVQGSKDPLNQLPLNFNQNAVAIEGWCAAYVYQFRNGTLNSAYAAELLDDKNPDLLFTPNLQVDLRQSGLRPGTVLVWDNPATQPGYGWLGQDYWGHTSIIVEVYADHVITRDASANPPGGTVSYTTQQLINFGLKYIGY